MVVIQMGRRNDGEGQKVGRVDSACGYQSFASIVKMVVDECEVVECDVDRRQKTEEQCL
jgi:hypothetical protein